MYFSDFVIVGILAFEFRVAFNLCLIQIYYQSISLLDFLLNPQVFKKDSALRLAKTQMPPSPMCALFQISAPRLLFVLSYGILLIHHDFVFTKGGGGPYVYFPYKALALQCFPLQTSALHIPATHLHSDLCLPNLGRCLCFAQDPPPCIMAQIVP